MSIQRRFAPVAVCCSILLASCAHLPWSDPDAEPADNASVPDMARPPDTSRPIRLLLEPSLLQPLPALAEPVPNDVWSQMRRGFVLGDQRDNPRVQAQLDAYLSHPVLLFHLEERISAYLPFVLEQVADRGLPMEVALLPFVESALDPYAFSHGGAAGLWQLIPATARRFGVTMDYWYDGRRDIVDSTKAALDYLEYLHGLFDDWLLVFAAYNAGEGRIRRARAQVGPDATFWDIRVPRETAAYVPRLLALSTLLQAPDDFNLTLPLIEPTTGFAATDLSSQVDLTQLAAAAEVPVELIFRLNPGLNHGATPPDPPHRLLLPLDHKTAIKSALADFPQDGVKWTPYAVTSGDTLGGIAQRFGTRVADIQAANQISGTMIRPGQQLLIPSPQVQAGAVPGNPLLTSTTATQTHQVAAGESLWLLASRYGTSVNALVRLNRLDPGRPLQVGQRLQLPGSTNGPSELAVRPVRYSVRQGDSLARIASRFNVKVSDLVTWNSLDPDRYLQPGQRLRIYVDIRSSWSS